MAHSFSPRLAGASAEQHGGSLSGGLVLFPRRPGSRDSEARNWEGMLFPGLFSKPCIIQLDPTPRSTFGYTDECSVLMIQSPLKAPPWDTGDFFYLRHLNYNAPCMKSSTSV